LVSLGKMRKSHMWWNKMEHAYTNPRPERLILAFLERTLSTK